MGKKIKVKFQGKLVDAIEMEFKPKEEWNIYELSDGTTLRMKPVATSIVKLVDIYDSEGKPLYMVQASNVLATQFQKN